MSSLITNHYDTVYVSRGSDRPVFQASSNSNTSPGKPNYVQGVRDSGRLIIRWTNHEVTDPQTGPLMPSSVLKGGFFYINLYIYIYGKFLKVS